MKKITQFALIIICGTLFSFNNGGYEIAMQDAIDVLYQARSQSELVDVANKFTRIGEAEKDEWLPYYYTAYAHIMMTTVVKEVASWDSYLDVAIENIGKADKLGADKAEILTLKGFASMMRINVDPATRGQEYSMKAAGFLQQAYQMDNQNPRAQLMLAQMQFGTAQFFGASTEDACKLFASANELYKIEAEEKRGIHPTWGKSQVDTMIKNCLKSEEQKE